MGTMWTIREVASETGLSADTLRYYDRIGLLPDLARSESGHRQFSEEDVARIRFLQCLRKTGMPIEKVQRWARLSQNGAETLEERRELLEAHRQAIEAEMRQLGQALELIERKIEMYGGASRAGSREGAGKGVVARPARRRDQLRVAG
jgi:DNA-binding transcriptional MerR regulator